MTEFKNNEPTNILVECVELLKSYNKEDDLDKYNKNCDIMSKLFFNNSFGISTCLANNSFNEELLKDNVNKYYPEANNGDDVVEILLGDIIENIIIKVDPNLIIELKETIIKKEDFDSINRFNKLNQYNIETLTFEKSLLMSIKEDSSFYDCYLILFRIISKFDIIHSDIDDVSDDELFMIIVKDIIITFWAISFGDESHVIDSEKAKTSRDLREFLLPLEKYLSESTIQNYKELFNYILSNINKLLIIINLTNSEMTNMFSDFGETLGCLNDTLLNYIEKTIPEKS